MRSAAERILRILIAAGLCATPSPSLAQEQSAPMRVPAPATAPPAPAQERPSGAIRAQSNLVRIDVEVTDHAGKPIRGLKPEQFSVTDDGKPQKITAFSFSDIEKI